MKQQNQEQQIYAVLVLRTDQDHIIVLESPDYEKCYNIWEDLIGKWTQAAKDGIPFKLSEPQVTAFSPGMITEIKLIPVSQINQNKVHNPYYQNMVRNGFANTQGGRDILDQGYSTN